MCRSHGTQSNASLKVAGFDRSFNRSSLAGFHRSLTQVRNYLSFSLSLAVSRLATLRRVFHRVALTAQHF
jgi:hypothetical protein